MLDILYSLFFTTMSQGKHHPHASREETEIQKVESLVQGDKHMVDLEFEHKFDCF